jgi:predicted aldo/keto reductase-like oxidoreductase
VNPFFYCGIKRLFGIGSNFKVKNMERRNFIRATALTSIALSIPAIRSFGTNFPAGFQLPKRTLGKTGEKLSAIGFGGIMLNDNTQEFANEIVAKAWDMGCNYYDVAPSYGNAESKLGPALKPYRKNAFLACKTGQKEAEGAERESNASFSHLETDWFDLYQLHALTSVKDVERCFAPGGMMEVVQKAKKEGKIRYVGFSAHSVDAALLAMSLYDFDTVMFPINFATWHAGDFGPQVYEKALEKNMGILALKAMALTKLKQGEAKYDKNVWYRPVEEEETMKIALKFTLSKEVTAAIPPGKSTLFLKAIEFMKDYTPITSSESDKLVSLAQVTEPLFRHG